jgi:hypothetical protein
MDQHEIGLQAKASLQRMSAPALIPEPEPEVSFAFVGGPAGDARGSDSEEEGGEWSDEGEEEGEEGDYSDEGESDEGEDDEGESDEESEFLVNAETVGGAAYSRKNEPPREWHVSHVRPSLFPEGPPTCAFGFCMEGPSLPGAVKHFGVLHGKSVLYGAFVWCAGRLTVQNGGFVRGQRARSYRRAWCPARRSSAASRSKSPRWASARCGRPSKAGGWSGSPRAPSGAANSGGPGGPAGPLGTPVEDPLVPLQIGKVPQETRPR